ncbi:MAG: GAF domain-containing protein [Desulfuromonadales bacterium]
MTIAFLVIASVSVALVMIWGKRNRKYIDQLQQELQTSTESCRQMDEQLENYRCRDLQFVQNAGEAMFIFDQECGSLLELNRQAEDLFGYTLGEATRLNFKDLISRENHQRVLRMISSVIRNGKAEIDDIRFRRKDGSQFIGEIKARTGHMQSCRIIYGNIRDVTQKTNLQLELRRNNRHLTLLNDISHRVAEGHNLQQTLEIILDQVIHSLAISGGGIFLLEYDNTEMKLALHRNIPDNVVEELGRIQPGMGLAGKVAQTGRPRLSTDLQKDHRRISSAVFADGWHAFLAVPFIAEEETMGVLFVFDRGGRAFSREDVRLMQAIGRQLGPLLKSAELFDELQWQQRLNFASLRELERSRSALRENLDQLEQHHRTLQSLNQMKSAFLSLASHELRTPLTTILSGAEFLQSSTGEQLGKNEQRALDVIMRGSQRLNHIVDDLLEAARLESRSLYMAREAINPLPMVKDILAEFKIKCEGRKLLLELLDFPNDSMISGDIHHLKRAFSRLLENAIKFTPEGGWVRVAGRILPQIDVVALSTRLRAFSENFFDGVMSEGYLQISISDSGIGIEQEDQLRIFDKFHEVGDISGHSTSPAGFGGKGVGLGLTLAKGIIETHEGLVWVESAGSAQGSCFSALLPLATPVEGKYVLG